METHETTEEWWRKHPAYNDLVNIFKGSTAHPNHLAHLVIVGLRKRGKDIYECS